MKPTLQAFVEAFIQSGASDRLDSVMQFYAPEVNYYEKVWSTRRLFEGIFLSAGDVGRAVSISF